MVISNASPDLIYIYLGLYVRSFLLFLGIKGFRKREGKGGGFREDLSAGFVNSSCFRF